jgi:hypothetical protein
MEEKNMHRSRLHTIVIDCDDLGAGVRFWRGAQGGRQGDG